MEQRCPQSAAAMTVLISMHNGAMTEPLDCTTPPALNLCTRRNESRSPSPEGASHGLSPASPDTNMPHTDNNNKSSMMDMMPKPLYFRPDTDSSDEKSSINSDGTEFTPYPLTPGMAARTKTARPFKAYPKDPFFLALGASTADAILGQESAEAYTEFRKKMMIQVQANNPLPGVTNTKMRRSSQNSNSLDGKDPTYWEKRRKNNEAAKRSRDARRAKEDEIAIRAAFLEQENFKLKCEVAALRNELSKQRCMIYN